MEKEFLISDIYIGIKCDDINLTKEIVVLSREASFIVNNKVIHNYKNISDDSSYLVFEDGKAINKDKMIYFKHLKSFKESLIDSIDNIKESDLSKEEIEHYRNSVHLFFEYNKISKKFVIDNLKYFIDTYCFAYDNPLLEDFDPDKVYEIKYIDNHNFKIINGKKDTKNKDK